MRAVSDRMLIPQIKQLEADNPMKQTDCEEVPPWRAASLAPLGHGRPYGARGLDHLPVIPTLRP